MYTVCCEHVYLPLPFFFASLLLTDAFLSFQLAPFFFHA